MIVYMAEFSDYECSSMLGLYTTEFNAFLACMYNYEKDIKWAKESYPKEGKRKSMNKKTRMMFIKRGTLHSICKIEILKEFKKDIL